MDGVLIELVSHGSQVFAGNDPVLRQPYPQRG